MRLIDADKIRYIDLSDSRVPDGVWCTFRERIHDMPTVEAIPIEWIREYTSDRTVEYGDMWVFIECMINDWEEK